MRPEVGGGYRWELKSVVLTLTTVLHSFWKKIAKWFGANFLMRQVNQQSLSCHLSIQSPANYHTYIVFCHVLRKRTLHNVNHQHENIQILQLLLNTYIHDCVKRRSATNDISEWERHCQQNLRVATEGKKIQVFVWVNRSVKKALLQSLKVDLIHDSSTQRL